jgi:hypothetical protein
MIGYEYLVVPFVGQLKKSVFSVENAQKVSEQLRDLINPMAKQGWEFYRIDKVDIMVKPGCWASLFGAKASFLAFDQVIFRREVPPVDDA